ncbi:hypothetical protein [Fibrisoma montanum]|nr:hypothetical protein [Fibrisoma montanum]
MKTMNAVVDVEHLIARLDIERLFSPTYGDIRELRPLRTVYKGLHLFIQPRADSTTHYSVQLRGSLAKFHNQEQHCFSFLDPYDTLKVLDDLATDLRVNLFETNLNNLEVTATVQVQDAKAIVGNALSYLGVVAKRGRMRTGLLYSDLQASQHRLKLYEPSGGLLRVEIHADKMAYFGNTQPKTLADLALPLFAEPMATKLLNAFGKVIWDCVDLEPDALPLDQGYLLAKGRNPSYWHVNKAKYNRADYSRIRKQRERERPKFDAIVQQNWTAADRPVEVERKIREQLTAYLDIMHTGKYERELNMCVERWQIAGCRKPTLH